MTPRELRQVLQPLKGMGAAMLALEAAATEMIRWESGVEELQARHAVLTAEMVDAQRALETAKAAAAQVEREAVQAASHATAAAQEEITRLRTSSRREIERLHGETDVWKSRAAQARATHDEQMAALQKSEADTRARVTALVEQARRLAQQAQAFG